MTFQTGKRRDLVQLSGCLDCCRHAGQCTTENDQSQKRPLLDAAARDALFPPHPRKCKPQAAWDVPYVGPVDMKYESALMVYTPQAPGRDR